MSWGPLICGKSGVPGVLADVSKALPWVRKVLAGKDPWMVLAGKGPGNMLSGMGPGRTAVRTADKVDTKKTLVWNGQGWKMQ